jgi:hypothetical protein
MSNRSVEAACEICDVLDTLLFIAKHDSAPMRAVSLLEQARSELQDYLDKTERDDRAAWSSSG